MVEANNSHQTTGRRWLRYSLRTLIIAVLLCALVAGWWTQRGRWWRYQLANGGDPQAYWSRLLKLSGIEENDAFTEEPLDIWPGMDQGTQNGWVWVRRASALRYVAPNGRVSEVAIVALGQPEVLWNGTTPEHRPGIVLFATDEIESYLMFITADPFSTVHLLVVLDSMEVNAQVIGNGSPPVIELSSNDGEFTERFSCAAEILAKGKPQVDRKQVPAKPWVVRLSR